MASAESLGLLWNFSLSRAELDGLMAQVPFPLPHFCKYCEYIAALDGVMVLDFSELRLPGAVAVDCKENEQDMLKSLVLHLRFHGSTYPPVEICTYPVMWSTGKALRNYVKVTLSVIAIQESANVFSDLDRWRFHRMFKFRGLEQRGKIFGLLGAAAAWHRSEIARHAGERGVKLQHTDYLKDVSRCDAALKSLQRLSGDGDTCTLDGFAFTGNVSSANMPLQLGYCDVADFLHSGDCCSVCKKSIGIASLIQQPCSSGTTSFKARVSKEVRKNYPYPPEALGAVMLHQLKQTIMQTFLSEDIVLHAIGSMESGGQDPDDSSKDSTPESKARPVSRDILFDSSVKKSGWPTEIRQHVVYIAPVQDFAAALQEYLPSQLVSDLHSNAVAEAIPPVTDDGDQDEQDLQRQSVRSKSALLDEFCRGVEKVPWQRFFGVGTFDLTRSWRNLERRCLTLQAGVSYSGEVIVLVGPYVGQYVLAAQISLQKRGSMPSAACAGLFGTHCDRSLWQGQGKNFWHGLTSSDVEAALASEHLTLSAEQRRSYDEIGRSDVSVIPVEAVPGGNKTTFGTGACLAKVGSLNDNELIGWLTNARDQRDEQHANFLRFDAETGHVICSGRAANEKLAVDSLDSQWDAKTAELLRGKLALHLERVESLKQDLAAYTSPVALGSSEWNHVKQLSEDLTVASSRLFQAELTAVSELLKHAKVVCCTVDAMLQICSGASSLARYCKGKRFRAMVVEEAHQCDLMLVGPLAMCTDSLMMLYDGDQEIDYSRATDRIVQRSVRLPGEHWPWQQSVSRRGIVPVWSCLAESPVRLSVCWRFGMLGVQYLQQVFPPYMKSGKDGQAKHLIASPMGSEYTVEERSRMPLTRFRFVTYTDAPVIASPYRGELKMDIKPAPPPRTRSSQVGVYEPVGCCPLMFSHMAHEGCVFLHALENGLVRLNTTSARIVLTTSTRAIGSFFYRSHVCTAFKCFIHGLLQRRDFLESYGLRPDFPYHLVWAVMTVDSASGRAVLLAQGVLIPRVVEYSDARGNYRDSGRFLVLNSRHRLFFTLYVRGLSQN